MSKKLPALMFYSGDWLKDPAVRSVSYAARGLWLDMLLLMHEGDRRGYLSLRGKPVSTEQLARMTGGSAEEVSRLLTELKDSGVFSCTDDGIIHSRRLVRDEEKRAKCSEAGKRGGRPIKGSGKGDGKGHQKGAPVIENGLGSSSPEENQGEESNHSWDGGLGEGSEKGSAKGFEKGELSAEWLARKWCMKISRRKGRRPADDAVDISPSIAELMRHVPAEAIDAEIDRPDRLREEYFWEFRQRLMDGKGKRGQLSPDEFKRAISGGAK